jgi:2-polyprenyl-3-methyl-5-hydroxy-6-metoxy-1,4-benzoquinol methylase
MTCPVCNSPELRLVFPVTDFTVSHQQFDLVECLDCSLRITQLAPGPLEIKAYYQSTDYISHSDTNKGLINRLYHAARVQTLRNKRKLISAQTRRKQGSLLDIGAGTGAFASHMQKAGWLVTGLEPDDLAREKAHQINQVTLLPLDELYKLSRDHYDAVTLWHVLEHVHELHSYMDRLKSLINPGGIIFIAVPNYTSYDAALYKAYWAAYDVPRHLYHFSPQSIRRLLKVHQMTLECIKPMWFDSIYISMLSEKYKTAHDRPVTGAINGVLSNLNTLFNREKCSSLIYVIRK